MFTRAFRRVGLKYLLTTDRVGCATQGARSLSGHSPVPGSRKLVKGRVKVICRRAAKLLPTFPTHRRISLVSFLIARVYLEKFDRK